MIVGLIGAGHIAQALAEGWSRSGLTAAPRLRFYDVDSEKAASLAARCGGEAAASLAGLVAPCDLIVVAVRPQHVDGVLLSLAPLIEERVVVSVAAGVTMDRLLGSLPARSRVARVMPNIPAALGLGVFLLVPGTVGPARQDVESLFALAGEVVALEEELFDAATAVAGCMAGMLARFVEAFTAAAEAHGVPADTAARLAMGGVHGAAALIAREGDAAAVSAAAATPGGMTEAAITALDARGLAAAVAAAVDAATARAKDLA
ncbi:MAG: pyrroline-5-carboxylate reductase dimerization domain-containing protein [Thermoleophilia bacterium]